jgi:hypothetical protein
MMTSLNELQHVNYKYFSFLFSEVMAPREGGREDSN